MGCHPVTKENPLTYARQRVLVSFKNHEITIEQDDGVYRCILFKNPKSRAYHFRIVTWPGSLAITGDIGSFIFSRERDMFGFFASGSGSDWAAMPLQINPAYWVEKAEAVDRRSKLDEFDFEEFKNQIVQTFRGFDFSSHPDGTRMAAWREVREALLEDTLRTPQELVEAAVDYMLPRGVIGRYTCPFADFWEYDFTKPGFTFLQCCYAIQFGIKKYAQHKEKRSTSATTSAILSGAV